MKIKLKMTALSAFILSLSIAGPIFAAGTPFKDIANVSAKDKITVLQNKGYINGIGEGLFAPNKKLTAAEGVTFIVNAFGLNLDAVRFIKAPKATDYFKNADDNAWYAETFITASVNGLELPNDLDPNKKWTKGEFTFYLTKELEKKGNLPMLKLIPAQISDEEQIPAEYQGAVQRSLVYGIVKLDAEKKFNPKAEITRAEAAEQVYNALEYLKAHSSTVEK